jgi:hypothetical protein
MNWDLIGFIEQTFSLLHSTETNYKSRPASYPKGARGSLSLWTGEMGVKMPIKG